MRGLEGDDGVVRELPGGRVRVEDVALGRLGREEVVVAWFAAYTAGGVGHLGRGHLGIDGRCGLGRADIGAARAIGLVDIGEGGCGRGDRLSDDCRWVS